MWESRTTMFRKGEKIGRYKLVKKLGSGAFGEVWLADREGKLGNSQVAIKLLRETQDLEQLKREAAVWIRACSPPHRNILSIFEADVIDEQPLIASEYASGGSLDDWLKANNGVAPSMEKAIHLTIEILKGLQHLHSKSIVHRDVKPQNILFCSQLDVGQDEVLKLADFGVAKVLGNSHTTGMFGTAAYVAPETLSAEEEMQDRRYSPQSDIWAVGIVLYQLVCGKLPFFQPVPAVFMAILKKDYPALPDSVPNILKEVIANSLEKDPDKRYQSARGMIEALQYCHLRLKKDHNQFGPYHLIKELGKGAFGQVFLAERRGKYATTKVAIKVLLGQQDHEVIAKEAQVWAQAGGHPNVLPMIEADVYDDLSVIVSEYVEGGSLRGWLTNNGGKAPSLESAVAMMEGILAGLEHLHSKNIIHRDLKPDNVLLQGQTPRISDFGLSRVVSDDGTNRIGGTLVYMSPEILLEGERSELGDLWAASVMFYQMLVGQLPWFDRDTNRLIVMIVSEQAPSLLTEFSIQVRDFVAKCLDKDRSRRYQSASQMRTAIKSCLVSAIEVFDPVPLMEYDRAWGWIAGGFVCIPAGEFMMGSENGTDRERPVRKVVISQSFEMGRYQVTQKQWQAVMGSNPSYFKGDDLPVESVSWIDVQGFIISLNIKSSKYVYSLPTEAQWEYACRSGTTGDYAGNLGAMAWYGDNSQGKTHPVGQKEPNAWGLYDMHGNVFEWCSDLYINYLGGASRGSSSRVSRGGGWGSTAYCCRSALRNIDSLDLRNNGLGFRLVRTDGKLEQFAGVCQRFVLSKWVER